ncbi:MAG: PilZ domain-containing protein [Chloroflexota bacterium]
MIDNRKEERKNLMAFTPVYGLHPKTLLGYVEDLTIHGAMLIGEKPVEIDKQITVMIEVPGAFPESTTPRLLIPARVAWCKQESKPNYYDIGLEFSDLEPAEITMIEAVLKRYEFHRAIPANKVE